MAHTTAQIAAARETKILFGKYKNRKLGLVADEDVLYLDWLAGLKIENRAFRDAIDVLRVHHADEIERAVEERSR